MDVSPKAPRWLPWLLTGLPAIFAVVLGAVANDSSRAAGFFGALLVVAAPYALGGAFGSRRRGSMPQPSTRTARW